MKTKQRRAGRVVEAVEAVMLSSAQVMQITSEAVRQAPEDQGAFVPKIRDALRRLAADCRQYLSDAPTEKAGSALKGVRGHSIKAGGPAVCRRKGD